MRNCIFWSKKKILNFFHPYIFPIFGYQVSKPWIRIGTLFSLKWWIRIRNLWIRIRNTAFCWCHTRRYTVPVPRYQPMNLWTALPLSLFSNFCCPFFYWPYMNIAFFHHHFLFPMLARSFCIFLLPLRIMYHLCQSVSFFVDHRDWSVFLIVFQIFFPQQNEKPETRQGPVCSSCCIVY